MEYATSLGLAELRLVAANPFGRVKTWSWSKAEPHEEVARKRYLIQILASLMGIWVGAFVSFSSCKRPKVERRVIHLCLLCSKP